MLIQKQQNNWSCLITAAAIAMNVEQRRLFDIIGHDGSEVWFHQENQILENSPIARRAFHIQEIIDCCLALGYNCTHIQRYPKSFNILLSEKLVPVKEKRFENYISTHNGIILGMGKMYPHAWAKYNGFIYDPKDFTIKTLDKIPNANNFYLIR